MCRTQLSALQAQAEAFASRGVTLAAVSCDTKERAEAAKADWKLDSLDIAYGLTLEQARAVGSVYHGLSRQDIAGD